MADRYDHECEGAPWIDCKHCGQEEDYWADMECPVRLRAEVERLRKTAERFARELSERDQEVAERQRLRTYARKLEEHLAGLADEVLTPVGADDAPQILARGALRYLDAPR